ncbi:MAG: WbqC family protein [Armatimonadota bacterium]|nr:WbqC family protein [Armatimonadota bacterium]
MIAAAHQLHYLPWLRYYHKIAAADVFVLLDDIQFEKNGWQNRNKIKGPQGALCLTVPVQDAYRQPINAVQIAANEPRWAQKHWRSLQQHYARAPFFALHADFFRNLYARPWESLAAVSDAILQYTLQALEIQTPVIRSSQLNVPGHATERLAALCRAVGADTYLSGAYALQAYLDAEALRRAGVRLLFQQWSCPTYRQLYPAAGFVPDLSIVDLLFNEGPAAREILLSGGRVTEEV